MEHEEIVNEVMAEDRKTKDKRTRYPRQWEQTKVFYKAMADRAVPYMVEGYEVLRFIGAPSNLFKEVCPSGLYAQVRNNLMDLKCISQIRRGGGKRTEGTTAGMSEWLLLQNPEEAFSGNPIAVRAVLRQTDSSNEGKIRSLHDRVTQLELEVVHLHRLVQELRGESPREPYVPTPPRNRFLEETVSLADKLEGT